MRVVLQVASGPHANRRVVLRSGQSATFGRTPAADHQFPDDPLMSGRHFSIELTGPLCMIRDLSSRNGTFVNDKLVAERAIETGCVIQAGDTRFSVLLEESDPATSAVSAPPPPVTSPAVPKPAATAYAGRAPSAVALSVAGLGATAVAPRSDAVAMRANETAPAPELVLFRMQAPPEYRSAVVDPDPLVRRSALLTATWKGFDWVLEYCRVLSSRPAAEHWDALLLLAILGRPDDVPRVLSIGRCLALEQRRFSIVAAFGHPQVMVEILTGMDAGDPDVAQAAAAAFAKVTGLEARCDSQWAAQQWQKLKSRAPDCIRWCRGQDVSGQISAEALKTLDLESRWEAALRGRYYKTWKSSRLDDEQLADKLWS